MLLHLVDFQDLNTSRLETPPTRTSARSISGEQKAMVGGRGMVSSFVLYAQMLSADTR